MAGNQRLPAGERRDAIIEAALPLFARWGEGVTTKDIAEAAGVSEALLYRHFPGKTALYEAILERCVTERVETLDFLDDLPDDTATLVACTYILIRRLLVGGPDPARDEGVLRLQLQSILGDGKFVSSFQEVISNPWADKIGRCLSAAHAAGDMHEDATDPRLAFLFGHHVAWATKILHLPVPPVMSEAPEPSACLHDMCRFILRGVGLKSTAISRHFNPQLFEMLLENKS